MRDHLVLLLLEDMLWSAIAALGFAILFNVPRRALIYAVLGGAVSHAFRTLIIREFHVSVELGTLLGSMIIGFWAKWCAQRLEMPSLIFAVAGAIPMVPGFFAYSTMIGLLQAAALPADAVAPVLIEAALNAIKTGLILAAIAVGIVSPTLLFLREKPVV
jgi:uncharacterized membrane protein YjjB (DUF3815 family)